MPLVARPTDEQNFYLISDAYELGLVGRSNEGCEFSELHLELDDMENFYIV